MPRFPLASMRESEHYFTKEVAGRLRASVLRPLFSVGMRAVLLRKHTADPYVVERLDEIVDSLDTAIAELRSFIVRPALQNHRQVMHELSAAASTADRLRHSTDDVQVREQLGHIVEWLDTAICDLRAPIDVAASSATFTAMQRTLLPARLPHCEGLEFSARFVAAQDDDVGGDWYDVFQLPSRDVWIVVGDVAGHGLEAAGIMVRLRAAVRAHTLEGHDPEDVLMLADRGLQFFEPTYIATLLVARLLPPYDRVRLASAGHLPPLLAVPDEAPVPVAVPITPPLGVGEGRRARSVTVDFPSGSALVAYTDGLVERRDESLETGIGRLGESFRADRPQEICEAVVEALIDPAELPRDDIALVVCRRN